MKNFKKVLAVMTAAASLCMSATAFAATGTVESSQGLTGTFNMETSVLDITNGNDVLANSETTILVLTADIEANEDTNVTEGKIMYINQQNTKDGKDFTGMGLKLPADLKTLAVGTYPIKVGCYNATTGAFEIKLANLVVSDSTTPGEEKTITIKLGDFNGDKMFTGIDVSYALRASIGALDACTLKDVNDASKVVNAKVGDDVVVNGITVKLGDFNGDKMFTGIDVSYALRASIGALDACTLKDVNDASKVVNAKVGDDVVVKVPETVE